MKLIRQVAIPAILLVAGATLAAANPPHTVHAARTASASQHAAIDCQYSGMCGKLRYYG